MIIGSLMKVESIKVALSNNGSWKPFSGLFESGHFTKVLLYMVFKLIYMWVLNPLM